MPTATLIHGFAVLSLLPMAGNELCVAAFVEPVVRATDESVQGLISPRFAALLGRVMPFWYAASLLLTSVDWWLTRSRMVAASGLLQVAILVLSIGFLVPINNRIATAQLQPGWSAEARRWDSLHTGRVLLLLVAAVLLVFAA